MQQLSLILPAGAWPGLVEQVQSRVDLFQQTLDFLALGRAGTLLPSVGRQKSNLGMGLR